MRELMHDPAEDRRLATAAQGGDRDAVDRLVRRHHGWILHLAQRMLWNRADAEDAAQEILTKAVMRLQAFEGRSEFRTWLYRIAANHLCDRSRAAKSFDAVALTLAEIPDQALPDTSSTHVDAALLIEETKAACTTGMLLCLEPRRRMAFLIGEVLGVTDDVGAEILETTPANFRQLLSRARRELYGFLQRHCGLVDETNSCRCAHKTAGFIARGIVTPGHLQFACDHVVPIRTVAADRLHEIRELDRRYAAIFRDERLLPAPDQAARLRELVLETGVGRSLKLVK